MHNRTQPVCLLFGANGQVGFELRRALALDYSVIAMDRHQCDMSDGNAISLAIQTTQPVLIVNAAAYTAVDKAEQEQALAYAINSTALEVIAREAKKIHAAIVHYSTVFVFDGTSKIPYKETDQTLALNVYGQSKLLGEQALFQCLDKDYPLWILRASWVYGVHGNNFLKQMINLACSRTDLSVVSDETGVPISASLIADLTTRLLQVRPAPGIYHLSCAGETNRFEYAKYIVEQAVRFGLPVTVQPGQILPVSTEYFKAAAKRPKNILMECAKLSDALSINLPNWCFGVEKTVHVIAENQIR
jgi:dTDP-4-dehydrorhamnose reductase